MTLQAALAEQLDSAQQAEVLSAAGEVSRRYRAREKKSFQIRNRAEALAYALARMPATYGAVCRALRYSLEGLGGLTQAPLSLLDVGAGTGAAAWAAAGLAELSSVTCWYHSPLESGLIWWWPLMWSTKSGKKTGERCLQSCGRQRASCCSLWSRARRRVSGF